MLQLVVTANKLNKRTALPAALPDKNNIAGMVLKGVKFEAEEVQNPANGLGKWYRDTEGYYYWGGGVTILGGSAETGATLPGMPVNVPPGAVFGMDISHHNSGIEWRKLVEAGVRFVVIKISTGVGTPDKLAAVNAANAINAGLKIGYYHFCRPDTRNGGTVVTDAVAEARYALSLIAALPKPDMPLVLDLENEPAWDSPLNKVDYVKWVKAFCEEVAKVMDRKPIIYTYKAYLDGKLPADHKLGGYHLWIANYNKKDCRNVPVPNGWEYWDIWQFTEKGGLGANKNLDLNIARSEPWLLT